MSRSLWPQKREDGSVLVAVRLRAAPSLVREIEALLANWKSWISAERRVDLGESLIRDPYIVAHSGDVVDVVFEGRSGSRLWRDWLVSFTSELKRAHPELKREGFWDLVGGSPNPASTHGETEAE